MLRCVHVETYSTKSRTRVHVQEAGRYTRAPRLSNYSPRSSTRSTMPPHHLMYRHTTSNAWSSLDDYCSVACTTHQASRNCRGQAGRSPTKLKTSFRTQFGSSVYLLRTHRMDEAERLLSTRCYSVTEVAPRVGYSNPSKFASAFRLRTKVLAASVSAG